PVVALLDCLHERGDVILAASDIAVLGVTAVSSERFDERDRGKGSVAQRGHEVALVLEVLPTAVGPVAVGSEVRKRLVMEHESGIGLTSDRVVTATGVSRTVDTIRREAVDERWVSR